MTRALCAMAIALASSACRAAEKSRADTTSAPTATNPDASAAANSDTATAAPPRAPAPLPRPAKISWTVTDSGAGVLRIGMTRDQLALDLHATPPKHTRADSGCAYLAVAGIPPGMRTMWVAATLARIDIGATSLATDRGAKIGDKQAKIESLYRGRVSAMPAKYDPHGKYLVIRPAPPADTTGRIVFETDGSTRVTRYRVGREPEVEWVEGCS